jgi:hypothetical protein
VLMYARLKRFIRNSSCTKDFFEGYQVLIAFFFWLSRLACRRGRDYTG